MRSRCFPVTSLVPEAALALLDIRFSSSRNETIRPGFLLARGPPDPDASSALSSTTPATAPPKRKDPPPPSGEADLPPSRAAKTAAASAIRQQAFPRAPLTNGLHAVRVAQLEKRRAADAKVAAFLDRFVRDLADLESSGSMNTDACRLFTAAAEAALAQALTTNARAPPDQLIKALRTWNPENAASADSIRLPDAPRSYATAARKGKGKASSRRPAPETIIPPTPPAPLRPLQGFRLRGQRSGSAEEAAAAADSRADDRLFARLSSQHELRTKLAYFLKKMLTDALSESGAPATIGLDTIKHVPSGLALRPSDTCTASELFEYHDLMKETLSADEVDISNQWHRYVLMNVPCFIDGEQVPDNIIADELEAALDCPLPEPPRRLGRPDALSLQRSSSVLFSLPRGRMPVGTQRLTVLGQRFSVRIYKEQKASENCDKCLSQHHTTAACTAVQPRCKSCGVEGHEASSDDCRIAKAAPDTADVVPLCYHCHGPHPAFFTGCYAAARYSKEVRAVTVPTGTRLARARKDGQRRRHQEIARQRVAAMARSSRTAQEQAQYEKAAEEDPTGVLAEGEERARAATAAAVAEEAAAEAERAAVVREALGTAAMETE
ncbi:unnamed protein product [Tilletia controversa]|nr:unnamed protein product [Tilletia controversa]